MILYGINKQQYTIGRELGRGGEGTVSDIQGQPGLVVKRYNEPLAKDKTDKLLLMVSMRSKEMEAYAAWPIDLVTDGNGETCGFVMRKLTGYLPLHMLFSPMDRKRLFPDKGYNFLVHVARNLATAFHCLHAAGLVVGDVNEGNILVNASGMVAFIDCDSFQVQNGSSYFFCDVGIPRYTPPELLKLRSFEHVVRTANTDSFSMAVLLFQLLFLGRHPFAGRNKTAADIDEETAIRKHEFAYSLTPKKKLLSPPADSLDIATLPSSLSSLFHSSFETDTRPLPADWVKELDMLLVSMVTCAVSRLHSYPEGAAECPWCRFRQDKGILYFIDDSYLHTRSLGDIESFINGFRVEKLGTEKWKAPELPDIAQQPIDNRFRDLRSALYTSSAIAFLFFAVTAIAAPADRNISISLAMLVPILIFRYSSWSKQLRVERARRRQVFNDLSTRLDKMITEHDNPPDANVYKTAVDQLDKLVHDFRRLPDEQERRKKLMEEQVYNEQLGYFLSLYAVEDGHIPSFGPAKKSALITNGIITAADLHKLQTMKIPGIGPKNIQLLLSWQRQLSTQFVYIPDNDKLNAGMEQVSYEVSRIRTQLEHLIRKEYGRVNQVRQHIANCNIILNRQLLDLAAKKAKAKADISIFKQFIPFS